MWWGQRYVVQLLNPSDGPSNFKMHRNNETTYKVIERIIHEHGLPDEATCQHRRGVVLYKLGGQTQTIFNIFPQFQYQSPAQIIFGRELRDTMPFKPGKGAMRKEWRITAEDRERALAKRHYTAMEKLNKHVKELKALKVGLIFGQTLL